MMKSQSGFTLVEVMVALVILAVVLLGLGAATGALVVRVTQSGQRDEAMQLAQDRLQLIQLDPVYDSLEARYATTGDTVPGHPGFVESTTIVHLGGSSQDIDHKMVTVSVNGPGLANPISRTVAVGAP